MSFERSLLLFEKYISQFNNFISIYTFLKLNVCYDLLKSIKFENQQTTWLETNN